MEHTEFYMHMDFTLSYYILYKCFNMDHMGSYSEQWTRNFTLLLSGAPTKEESINKEEEEEDGLGPILKYTKQAPMLIAWC